MRRFDLRLLTFGLLPILAWTLVACVSTGERGDKNGSAANPAEVHTRLGVAYMQQGNPEMALEKFQRALELNPNYADAHHYIAELYRQQGNVDLAEKHFLRALRLDGANPALQNNYGVFLCGERRYAEAEERFLKAARTRAYEDADEAYENAGICMLKDKNMEKAERYFRKALTLNSKLPQSLYQMANLSWKEERYLQARGFLQRHMAIGGYTPQNLLLGFRIEQDLGDKVAANQYAELLKQNYPNAEETRLLPIRNSE